jgi:hypothetical protein
LWYSTVIAVGLVALVWSADRFVDGASAIAKRAGLTPMLIGLTIVSVGTSAPEILISIMSALADSGELAVGNALGSNIANVGLVLGVTLLFSSIRLGRDTIWIDLPLLMLVVLVTWFLLYDLELSRSDSFVLLGMLALFFVRVGQHARQTDDDIEAREIPTLTLPLAWLSFIGGLILLIASSRLLVWAATHIATALGVSELVIGLTYCCRGDEPAGIGRLGHERIERSRRHGSGRHRRLKHVQYSVGAGHSRPMGQPLAPISRGQSGHGRGISHDSGSCPRGAVALEWGVRIRHVGARNRVATAFSLHRLLRLALFSSLTES